MSLSVHVPLCAYVSLCVSVSVCVCVCAPVYLLIVPPCAMRSQQGGSQAHQLDDVGDAEPVGLPDVLASLHEAFIALKVRG